MTFPTSKFTATGGPRPKDSGMRNLKTQLTVMLTIVLVASSCGWFDGDDDADGPGGPGTPSTSTPGGDRLPTDVTIVQPTGEALMVSLRNGEPLANGIQGETNALVDGEPLDDGEVQAILDRVGAGPIGGDRSDFERPVESLTPPLVAGDDLVPWPPDTTEPEPDTVPEGPLEVLRHSPVGEVDVAGFVTVTFNQPMVPLSTLEQLDQIPVPIRITPDIEGKWQWIGTRIARFDHASDAFDRLPMATTFTVEIPAGTTSETGGELAETVAFEFETPAARPSWLTPTHDSLPLEPIFVAGFDQLIDADDMLAVTGLTANGEPVEIRLATDDELAADKQARSAANRAIDGRWFAFTPTSPLPADAKLVITIGPDIPSAEGPNTHRRTSTFEARTYPPLGITDHGCWDGCPPDSPWWITFNNRLDKEAFEVDDITVEPSVPGLRITAEWSSINIVGGFARNTDYTVTVPAGITDEFGQTLGSEVDLTFEVGTPRRSIHQNLPRLVTLDPFAEEPALSVSTTEHDQLKVTVREVDIGNWNEFLDLREGRRDDDFREPDWPVAFERTIDVDRGGRWLDTTQIDLSDALGDGPGHVVVTIESTVRHDENEAWANRPITVWVQRTDLGVDALSDSTELTAWVTDLSTGEPVGGVDVNLTGTDDATTNADGIGTLRLPPTRDEHRQILVASNGDDTAILHDYGWSPSPLDDQTIWHVFTDRGIYRPGETVSVKGWLRTLEYTANAQLTETSVSTVRYQLYDSFGNEMDSGSVDVNALGGFDFQVDVAPGSNLGHGSLQLATDDGRQRHVSVRIEEFRRPEFEVTVRAESPGPYLATEPATVAVGAAYFSGGPLPDAEVEWRVSTNEATYSPPGHDEFTFGKWIPWWFQSVGFEADFFPGPQPFDDAEVETFAARTDGRGEHYLALDFSGGDTGLPSTVSASSTVTDVNRQAFADSVSLLVHAADRYIGVRSPNTFVRPGDTMRIEAIVTDIDGAVSAGAPATIEFARLDHRYIDDEWTEVVIDPETCEFTSGADRHVCEFTPEVGGRYRVLALVTDTEGRANRTEMTRWVSGGRTQPQRNVELEELTIVPDAAEYQPGDTAEVLVQAPFSSGSVLMTVTRADVESTTVYELVDGSVVAQVPVAETDVPNINVQFDAAGSAERTNDDGSALPGAPPRPAFATARVTLPVPPKTRTLDVSANPVDEVTEPGAETSIEIEVRDADGTPVEGAELALVVVDEAILALTSHDFADPLNTFYADIHSRLRTSYGRRLLVLADPDDFAGDSGGEDSTAFTTTTAASAGADGDDAAAEAPAVAGGEGARVAQGDGGSPIDLRTNFDALAVFAPEVATDASGRVTVDVPLPDSLTRYRVFAAAVAGEQQFGSTEANITARLPLQVRPSAPRFANFGDRFELPVVVANQTDADMVVDVAVQAGNLDLPTVAGKRVTVEANDRVEVRFDVTTVSAGSAELRVVAVSGDLADAAQVLLPVYTPATTEAFATYGVLDEGATGQTVLTPEGVVPQFGGLEVSTSSSAVSALTDAVLYLHEYRYRSSDALASRIMAITALRDVLEAFDADGLPSPAELSAAVQRDIDDLLALQMGDGGFGSWSILRRSDPYRTIQATHALTLARDEGYDVDAQQFERAMSYLRTIESHYERDWSQRLRDTLSSYALNVRKLAGEPDAAKANALFASAEDRLGFDALAWLWPVLTDAEARTEIERRFNNATVDTAGAATFSTNYDDQGHLILHSDRRTDGIILSALISEVPDSDLIPKVVSGLLGHRRQGRWNNVQENGFILLAMDQYFETFEAVDPDFVARVWLGDLYAAEHEYEGRTVNGQKTLIPMTEVLEGDGPLVVSKDGEGRLYWRLGLRYAPDDLSLDPLDRGFVVTRTYEAVEDPGDVWRDAEGVWHVKAGAEVRVKLTMTAETRRTQVALVDPMPAGFEALNPALATTGPVEVGDDPYRSYWWWRWFEQQNLRDDRAEAITSLLSAGTYDYTYVVRATTPGTFVVPPAKAEEIYAPETFGRTASATVVVED